MTGVKKYKWLPAALLTVIILCLTAYIIWWGTQKEGYYIDDMFSLMDIRGDSLPRPYLSDDFFDTWLNAAWLETTIVVPEAKAFSDFGEYESIYRNLLHAAYSLQPDVFSVWPAIILNLIFFAGTLIALYMLSRMFIDDAYLALLPVMLWGVSGAAVNMAVLIRFYSLKVFAAVLLTYAVLKFLEETTEDPCSGIKKWRCLAAALLFIYIGANTHQYFLVFTFYLVIFACLYLLINKQKKTMLVFAGVMAAGGAGYLYITGWSIIRQLTEMDDGVLAVNVRQLIYGTDDFPQRITGYMDYVSNLIFAGIDSFIIAALFIILIVISVINGTAQKPPGNCGSNGSCGTNLQNPVIKKKQTGLWLIMGAVSMSYLVTIARITPGVPSTQRYMFCITPLLVVMFISLLLYAMENTGIKRIKLLSAAVAVTGVVLLTTGFTDIHVYRGDRAINETLEAYHHLPVLCVNRNETRVAQYYWQLFEFDDDVLFVLADAIDYGDIKKKPLSDGLLVIIEAFGGTPIKDISEITAGAGLGSYKLVATLPGRYWEFQYYYLS